jgi:hypothetical protein
MDSYTLPNGAKGIEGEGFAFQVGRDKVIFVPKSAGRGAHYTFQTNPASGVIDLHETVIDPDGQERHRTLFAYADHLPTVLGELAPMASAFFRLMRPLRLGWLKHRHIGIARGVDPLSDADVAATTTKRRGRLSVDPKLYEQNIYVPEYLEEIYDFPDGNFSLHHGGRQIGIGFKKTERDGRVHLFWIKDRDLTRCANAWRPKVAAAFTRIAIPPERYPEYAFLRP